jgi:hypothetical protein
MSELQGPRVSADEARMVLDEILARSEFRQGEDFLLGLLRDFLSWLGDLFGDAGGEVDPATLEAGLRLLWISVAVAAGAVLVWYWASLLRSRRRRNSAQEARLWDEVSARVASLRAEARAAQAQGDLTRALRLYFFALVVGLGQRGELAYDDAWTNRELLERGEPSASLLELLGPLVGELDAHSFGRRPTDLGEVQRFAGLCDRLLGGGPV